MRLLVRKKLNTLEKYTRNFLSVPEFMQPSSLRKEHRERKIVPFSCQEMYDVVVDVEKYVQFLPFCIDSRIIRRHNSNVMEADLTVGFQIFKETYRSRVEMNSPHRVLIKSVESPTFKSIESEWSFREVSPTSCEVNFRVAFEVASILHSHAMRLFFEDVARVQLNAFIKQATNLQLTRPRSVSKPPTPTPTSLPRALSNLREKLQPTILAHLHHIFAQHAKVTPEGKHLYLAGFGSACKDLLQSSPWARDSKHVDDLQKISGDSNSALASAVFTTFLVRPEQDTPGTTHDWLSFDEFAMGMYLMLYGSLDEKAVHLFQVIDETGDGYLSPDELRRAMQRRIRVVKDNFPMLLQEQLDLHIDESASTTEQMIVSAEGMKLGLMAIETLMAQVETDIPLAVNQIFLSANLAHSNRITLDEWRHMWQTHPELVELMTIDGMKKIMQWATVGHPTTPSN